jgi:hypothetical protein
MSVASKMMNTNLPMARPRDGMLFHRWLSRSRRTPSTAIGAALVLEVWMVEFEHDKEVLWSVR